MTNHPSDPVTTPYLALARQLALEAGQIIREKFGQKVSSSEKPGNDIVTEVDLASEKLVREGIAKAYPDHSIYGEEEGGQLDLDGYCWILDPLDGTKNFFHGIPQVSVSIALAHRGKVTDGVVYNPITQELYSASLGKGAFYNDQPIGVSDTQTISKGMFITGFAGRPDGYQEIFFDIQQRSHALRRLGSAALDLCFVAHGRADAFWEWGLNPWDVAAGSLIISEAQGQVTSCEGTPFDLRRSDSILASNVYLHAEMVRTISHHLK